VHNEILKLLPCIHTRCIDSANGVLIVKIHSANGLRDTDLFGTLDPYITLHIGNPNNAQVGRTKQIEDNKNPKFDETLFVLINNINDTLVLEVMDRNTGRSDSSIGTCTFDMKSLAESDNLIEGLYVYFKRMCLLILTLYAM